MTESPSTRLRQRRATLGALQGDPDAPAAGTLYARRRRLEAELQWAQAMPSEAHALAMAGGPLGLVGQRTASVGRSVTEVMHELRQIDEQIESVQRSIDEIDEKLTDASKSLGVGPELPDPQMN
jgi:hypothetical protein